ncbi:MAG TPA: hypothetical protein VGJ81_10730 [Thermoanaerobaculia bacterium]|jgi:hypothetical protein
MKRKLSIAFALMSLLALPVLAQEHPEHPANTKKDFSTSDLEKAIKHDIAEKAKATDGVFKVDDPELHKTWDLKLDHVHTERLSKLNADTYFACVDMKDPHGKVIDVDFFLKSDGDKLEMTDTTVHKVEGKPRYNWKEADGWWKKVPVKSDAK